MKRERIDRPRDDKIGGIVKLLKFVRGKWHIVDYGVPSKIDVYIALGYVVQR